MRSLNRCCSGKCSDECTQAPPEGVRYPGQSMLWGNVVFKNQEESKTKHGGSILHFQTSCSCPHLRSNIDINSSPAPWRLALMLLCPIITAYGMFFGVLLFLRWVEDELSWAYYCDAIKQLLHDTVSELSFLDVKQVCHRATFTESWNGMAYSVLASTYESKSCEHTQ